MATACIISSNSSGGGSVIATLTEPVDDLMASEVNSAPDSGVESNKHLLQVPGQHSEAEEEDNNGEEDNNFEDE